MNTAIALANTSRAPNRSAVQPLAGMNTASDSRYEVIASFSVSGLVPMSAAIAGSEVAITVESMFSMNSAVATISGIRRCLFIRQGERKWRGGRTGITTTQAATPLRNGRLPKNCVNGRDITSCIHVNIVRCQLPSMPPQRKVAGAHGAGAREVG